MAGLQLLCSGKIGFVIILSTSNIFQQIKSVINHFLSWQHSYSMQLIFLHLDIIPSTIYQMLPAAITADAEIAVADFIPYIIAYKKFYSYHMHRSCKKVDESNSYVLDRLLTKQWTKQWTDNNGKQF